MFAGWVDTFDPFRRSLTQSIGQAGNEEPEDDTTLSPVELANVLAQRADTGNTVDGYEIEEESRIVKPYELEEDEDGVGAPPISDMALEAFLVEVAEQGPKPCKRTRNRKYDSLDCECT